MTLLDLVVFAGVELRDSLVLLMMKFHRSVHCHFLRAL